MNSFSEDGDDLSLLSQDKKIMPRKKRRKEKIKIVLVGQTDVGKTAIAQRYFFDYYPE